MSEGTKGPILGALACVAALLALAAVVFGIDAVQRVDSDVLGSVMTRTGDEAGPVVNGVARWVDPLSLALLLFVACSIALLRRRPLDAAAAAAVVLGANLTTEVLKHVFEEPRIQPHLLHGEQLPIDIFPSGHATAAASIAIAYAFVVPRARLPLAAALGALFVAAVDVCVLILAWHFPSDVIAGTLVAGAWGFGALAAQRSIEVRAVSPRSGPPGRRSSPAPRDLPESPG